MSPSASSTVAAGTEGRPRVLFEPPPRPGQRQPLDEDQLLDPQHQLDVGAAIDAAAGARAVGPRPGNSASHERSTYGCSCAISQTSGALNSSRLAVAISITI